jgi:hypothetical protein
MSLQVAFWHTHIHPITLMAIAIHCLAFRHQPGIHVSRSADKAPLRYTIQHPRRNNLDTRKYGFSSRRGSFHVREPIDLQYPIRHVNHYGSILVGSAVWLYHHGHQRLTPTVPLPHSAKIKINEYVGIDHEKGRLPQKSLDSFYTAGGA